MNCPHRPTTVDESHFFECTCTKDCPRHGQCCACVAHHRAHGKLPHCLRPVEAVPQHATIEDCGSIIEHEETSAINIDNSIVTNSQDLDPGLEDGRTILSYYSANLNSIVECRELLESDAFETYVTVLSQRNFDLVKNGFRRNGYKFLVDLLRCTQVAQINWQDALRVEHITFEEYKATHYVECMIYRDNIFAEVSMPQEPDDYMGTSPVMPDVHEVKYRISLLRDLPSLFGWEAFASFLDKDEQ